MGEKREREREQHENTVSQREFWKKSEEYNKREIIRKLKGGHKQPRQERITAVWFVEGENSLFYELAALLFPARRDVPPSSLVCLF